MGLWGCIDFRKLNEVLSFDAYPMSRVDVLINMVGDAQVLSHIDVMKGCWQIPLAEATQEKMAFTTPSGL